MTYRPAARFVKPSDSFFVYRLNKLHPSGG